MARLSEQEREELEARFRQELEEEHERRLRNLETRKQRARQHRSHRHGVDYEREAEAIRQRVREAFYREKGYRLYVDSTGKERWVPPDEYEWLQKRRRRKVRRRRYKVAVTPRLRVVILYVGIAFIAVILGLLVVK